MTATPQQPPRFRGVLSDAHAQLARRIDAHEQGGQSVPCPFPDCHRPIRARGLCSPHYRQQLAGKKLTVLRDWRPAA